jgi:acyl-CoA synthetase (AMP-forming)/AMP-acid ligase II
MRSFSVYDMYQRNARLYKDRTAVVTDGLRLSFEELLRDSNVFAAALVGMGIDRGDRVAVLAMNDHRFFTVFGAVAAIGAIVVPLNWRLSNEETAFILVDSGARVLISDGDHAEKAEALAGMVGGIETICWSPPDGRNPSMNNMAKDVLPVETPLSDYIRPPWTAGPGGLSLVTGTSSSATCRWLRPWDSPPGTPISTCCRSPV